MVQGTTHSLRTWLLPAVLLCALTGFGTAGAAEGGKDNEGETIAELAERVENGAEFSQDRVAACQKLGTLREPNQVRDQRVIDRLLKVAGDEKDDLFVRNACVKALGSIQSTIGGDAAVNKYIEPFLEIIKDDKEEELLRVEVIDVFRRTISSANLAEERAYEALIDMAASTGAQTRHKMPLIVRIASIRALEAGARRPPGQVRGARPFSGLADILNQARMDPAGARGGDHQLFGAAEGPQGRGQRHQARYYQQDRRHRGRQEGRRVHPQRSHARRRAAVPAWACAARRAWSWKPSRRCWPKKRTTSCWSAAIEALGITGDADALPALEKAYTDMYVAASKNNPVDVRIRTAIMKTLGQLLDAQRTKRPGP